MSGGSYNYVCWQEPDEVELESLFSMAKDMRQAGYPKAADEVYNYMEAVRTSRIKLSDMAYRLRDIMHDWEWYQSNDNDIEPFEKSLKELLLEEK